MIANVTKRLGLVFKAPRSGLTAERGLGWGSAH